MMFPSRSRGICAPRGEGRARSFHGTISALVSGTFVGAPKAGRVLLWAWLSALACHGCARPAPRADALSGSEWRVQHGQETLAVLERYLVTADWRDRRRIAEADDEDEILASRIFRAFDLYVGCGTGMHETMETARAELFRNTSLTLTYLRPVVDELLDDPEKYGGSMLPAGDEYAEAYVHICTEIAQVEEDGRARAVLRGLVSHHDEAVRKDAQSALVYLEDVNIFSVGRRYRENQAWKDLQWVSAYYLRRGMPRSWVEQHLGPGEIVNSYTVRYEGKEAGRMRRPLRIQYYDGLLDAWGWM